MKQQLEHATYAREVQSQLWVRPADLDRLGHVNNSRVLEYLEFGRWDWLQQSGRKLNDHVAAVVSRIEIDYRREISLGEISVTTRLCRDDSMYRAIFSQRVLLSNLKEEEPTLASEARVHIAFIGLDDRRLRTIDESIVTMGAL